MRVLDDFTNAKILVVGDIMLDRYWWGSVSRISPEAPVPVVRLKRTTLAAGGAANVAANIAGLGAHPLLFGVIGTDDEANSVRRVLSDLNVSSEHLVQIPDRPTTVKTRVIAHSQQVARIDNEMDSDLPPDIEAMVKDRIAAVISDVHAIVISDYAKGLLSETMLADLITIAADSGKPVLVDPKGKNYLKYRGATIITPNRREAAEACNFDESGSDLVDRAGAKLIDDLLIDAVLITQGEEGMTLFRRDCDPVSFAAAAREVYDVTGAGDTVIATLAAAVGAGADLETGTNLANIAAGLVVEQVGTTSIGLIDLRRAIEASRTSG